MVENRTDASRLAKRLGKRIAERRKGLGWTQDRLAERMGVDAETISRFERGAHLPSLPTLERLATALRVEIGELLSRKAIPKLDSQTSLDAWMDGLSVEDRGFVMAVARDCSDYLRKKSSEISAKKTR
jgi:transcriptional regulator with XRE-family HTH domain